MELQAVIVLQLALCHEKSQQIGPTASDILEAFRTLCFTPAKIHQTLHVRGKDIEVGDFVRKRTDIPQAADYMFGGPF